MSEENVEAVRHTLELAQGAYRRGDHGAMFDQCVALGLLSPKIEWKAGFRGGTGVAGVSDFAGREGYVDFVRRWTEDFEDFAIETERIIDISDGRVLAITRQTGTGKESRVPVELQVAMIFSLEKASIIRVTVFLNPDDALEAAGLSE